MREIKRIGTERIDEYMEIYFNSYPAYKTLDDECRAYYRDKTIRDMERGRDVEFFGCFEDGILAATMKIVDFDINLVSSKDKRKYLSAKGYTTPGQKKFDMKNWWVGKREGNPFGHYHIPGFSVEVEAGKGSLLEITKTICKIIIRINRCSNNSCRECRENNTYDNSLCDCIARSINNSDEFNNTNTLNTVNTTSNMNSINNSNVSGICNNGRGLPRAQFTVTTNQENPVLFLGNRNTNYGRKNCCACREK